MRLVLVLLGVLGALPLAADGTWTLKKGPTLVQEIPLVPVQEVAAWRGLYSDDSDRVWVYVTKSPSFFPPRTPVVREISGTPWVLVAFFPGGWKPSAQTQWLDSWEAGYRNLASLPPTGLPVLFPSVLK